MSGLLMHLPMEHAKMNVSRFETEHMGQYTDNLIDRTDMGQTFAVAKANTELNKTNEVRGTLELGRKFE
jgi:hypothetical protein